MTGRVTGTSQRLGARTAGGLVFLTNSFAGFLSPALAARLPDIGMLGGVAELALSLWLMATGVNTQGWGERANVWQNGGG